MHIQPNTKKPYFITVEGIEGAGKSTAIRFIKQWLTILQVPHKVTREPGGTEIAEAIRQIFLTAHAEAMAADTELLLMFAGRAQHLAQVILPALKAGEWVLCDRFTDATYAYQGGGRGLEMSRIAQLENLVQGELRPDLVFLLDIPAALGLQRIKNRRAKDRIEQEEVDFFGRVRQVYLERARQNPDRYRLIDASQPLSNVQLQIKRELESFINKVTDGRV